MTAPKTRARRAGVPVRSTATLPPPPGLAARTFRVGDDEYVVFEFPTVENEIPSGLSQSECAIVRAVLLGRSNKEIAAERGTSHHTVAHQLRSIYAKLGVDGRTALIRSCRRVGSEQ